MAREYHSPSSIALGRRCQRAWAYAYIDGIRRPEVPWSDSLKGRDRSLALGKAVHACIESHYLGRPEGFATFPGAVATSGLPFLPTTGRPEVTVGHGSHGVDLSGERRGVRVGGVVWHGFRDLVSDAPLVVDYKTTASIEKYAKGPLELASDVQANLYCYDTALEYGADECAGRWVYFETGRVRRAIPVDFVLPVNHSLEVLEAAAEDAKALDLIERSSDAPMNVHACADYGGCEYHHSAGGPCSAQRSFGSLVQARVPKRKEPESMAIDKMALSAKLKGLSLSKPAAAPAPEPEGPTGSEPAPAPENTPTAAEAPPPPVTAKRGPRAKATAPAGEISAKVAAAAMKLAEAEQAKAAAESAYQDALAEVRAAVA